MNETRPGSPEPLTAAQKLLVIANRLDGMLAWLGEGHPGYYMIRDMPEAVRAVAVASLQSSAVEGVGGHRPDCLGRDHANRMRQRDIAKKYGMALLPIQDVIHGRSWTHVK